MGEDEHCPECGADPADALNPLFATSDAPELEQWVSDHDPGCAVCAEGGRESALEFIPADKREPGFERLWWRCPRCDALITEVERSVAT